MACALMCKPINIKSVRALASYRAQSLDIPLYRSSAKRFFPKMQKTLPLDCDFKHTNYFKNTSTINCLSL